MAVDLPEPLVLDFSATKLPKPSSSQNLVTGPLLDSLVAILPEIWTILSNLVLRLSEGRDNQVKRKVCQEAMRVIASSPGFFLVPVVEDLWNNLDRAQRRFTQTAECLGNFVLLFPLNVSLAVSPSICSVPFSPPHHCLFLRVTE